MRGNWLRPIYFWRLTDISVSITCKHFLKLIVICVSFKGMFICSNSLYYHGWIQEIWKGGGGGGGGGSDMKINRGRPPARSAEAFGGPAISDTDYLSIL